MAADQTSASAAFVRGRVGLLLILAGAHDADRDVLRGEAALMKAIEIAPALLTAYSMLGRLYLTETRRMLERYLTLDPASPRSDEARRRLAALGA